MKKMVLLFLIISLILPLLVFAQENEDQNGFAGDGYESTDISGIPSQMVQALMIF
jgi:hypothetical protein